jgi:hypothetical protein
MNILRASLSRFSHMTKKKYKYKYYIILYKNVVFQKSERDQVKKIEISTSAEQLSQGRTQKYL